MAETAYLSTPPKIHSPTPGAIVTVDPTISVNQMWSPNEDESIVATTPGKPGQNLVIVIFTLNGTTRTLTFSTNFKAVSTLVTGAVAARYFVLEFVSTGLFWIEKSRTAAIT